MTEKQLQILESALELFALEGYKATSTSKVAKRAGVSEGLIFRHFGNKDGLLKAIMQQAEEKAKVLFADIVLEEDPKEVIRKTLSIARDKYNDQKEADFWKLQYKIKWELEEYGAHKMKPLHHALTIAFEKLNYEDPEAEALELLLILDGMATRFYLQEDFQRLEMVNHLMKKYKL